MREKQILASGGYDDNIDTAKSPYHAVTLAAKRSYRLQYSQGLYGIAKSILQTTVVVDYAIKLLRLHRR